MGVVQSTAKSIWRATQAVQGLNDHIKNVLKRASEQPGFPVKNPTDPYWTGQPLFPDLADAFMPLPSNQADIVIIGSGLTAAAVARSVFEEGNRWGKRRRIVVLESRSLCSGATGRSSGHIKSTPHELFAAHKSSLGATRAAKLARLQLYNLIMLREMCNAKGWDIAECRELQTVDLFLNEEDRDAAFRKMREMRNHIPEFRANKWDGREARKWFDVNKLVKGAMTYTAGAIWPYAFVSLVWKELLYKYKYFLFLQTNTPVLAIETTQDNPNYAYGVITLQGTILCNHVVHATNAFAPELVPGLRGKLTGLLGTTTAQRPGVKFPDRNGKRSWSVIYGQHSDNAVQRPSVAGRPGDLLVSGGFSRSLGEGASSVGVWDDSQLDPLPVAHLGGILSTIFDSKFWGSGANGRSGSMKAWTGIIGVTGDMLPLVGRLGSRLTGRKPDLPPHKRSSADRGIVRPGEWISAGYCGDGMVWAWMCGTALGVMLSGTELDNVVGEVGRPDGPLESWFPAPDLAPSAKRLKNARLENLADRFI